MAVVREFVYKVWRGCLLESETRAALQACWQQVHTPSRHTAPRRPSWLVAQLGARVFGGMANAHLPGENPARDVCLVAHAARDRVYNAPVRTVDLGVQHVKLVAQRRRYRPPR